jgi:hypothetical protein
MRIRLASDKGRTVAKDSIYEVRELCIPNSVHPISIFIAAYISDVRYRTDHYHPHRILHSISTEMQSGPTYHMDILGGTRPFGPL